MPRINTNDVYGTQTVDTAKTFRERLMKRFAAHEWVRVINIDNEPFRWQYLPAHSEEFEFTPDPMKITRRGEVEVYLLNPGASEVILGECAYLMIENLYKKLVSKKTIQRRPDVGPGQARNFNWTDPQSQEELIDRIYLGKESPTFGSPEKDKEDVPATPALKKRRGRAPASANRLKKTV